MKLVINLPPVTTPMISSHTDVVGSLLRTSELVAVRKDLEGNRMTHAEFKAVEDRAVDDAIALQEEAGLEVVTDGEMRRLSFQSQMTEAVEGFGSGTSTLFSGANGTGRSPSGTGSAHVPRPSES